MPFKSDKQRRWMFANEPAMAKRWVKHVSEMPHLEADIEINGKDVKVVDLNVEKYPVSKEDKDRIFRAFSKSGVVGEVGGEYFHFKPDYTVEVIDKNAASRLLRLPMGWDRIMKFVSESKSIPSLMEVFRIG